MTTTDFTTAIRVTQTPQEAFHAINQVRAWWSENIDGHTDQLHSEFAYHHQDIHRCTLRIVELIPAQKVVWLVTDNYFNFIADQREWKDTRIIFEIAATDGQTEIRFTHQGLTPQDECYLVCQEAWTYYIRESLRSLVVSGKGNPTPKDSYGYNHQLAEKWNLSS